jgi:stage V sporulation protein D (sporulation-specific penicillin-binding protein)
MAVKKKYDASTKARKRLLVVFVIIMLAFVALAVRLGYHQIYMAEDYAQRATLQQTSDKVVSAVRGSILDRNGGELAISATTNTIWVRTDSVRGNGKTEQEKEENALLEAHSLADILDLDYEDVLETITSERKLLKVAKNVSAATADIIREGGYAGIEIVEDAKRYYPLGAFASQILGTTTDDNVGLTGIERYYDRYLSGINGRWITSKDGKSNSIVYGTDKYYAAEDGYSVELTIDSNIQYIVEQKIAACLEKTQADRVMCLMMDPKTGEILAMAQTEEYDPNDPRVPINEEDKQQFVFMSDAQKVEYWNRIWRAFCISDTYEPGSTFKLITTAIALDERVTTLDDTFYCNGTLQVADWLLKCWYYPRAHGKQTLVQAVGNSCNPVMIQLGQRLGLTRYYNGLDAFSLTERTGVDYPGEGTNILQSRSSAGPVGLATMAYGQGIAVTPISLVTAISSLANEGRLMQPHFLRRVVKEDGEVVLENEPVIKSISVSEQTAADMLYIMEETVDEGGGGTAKIRGYRIGGKTGTANKPEGGGYSKTDVYGSFIGVAPINDPKFVILVIVDTPRGVLYGSQTAAPCAREIMNEVFLYLDIQPDYTEEDLAAISKSKVDVPNLTGYTLEDSIGILAGRGLEYQIAPEGEYYENLIIIDQFPKPGEELSQGSIVTLYYEPGEEVLEQEHGHEDEEVMD